MSPGRPSVSVLVDTVPTTSPATRRSLLSSLHQQLGDLDEIVVLRAPDTVLLDAGEDPARARAVDGAERSAVRTNQALEGAAGGVVVMLDDDLLPDPDWLGALLEPYEDPAVVGVGGAVFPRWIGPRPPWFPASFNWVLGCSWIGLPAEPGVVRNTLGAHSSYRRELLLRVGGLSDVFAGQARDSELAARVSAAEPAGRILYAPTAVVRRELRASDVSLRWFLRRCRGEGEQLGRWVTSSSGVSVAPERRFVTQIVPTAVLWGLIGRDGTPLRSVVSVLGLLASSIGFLSARLRAAERKPSPRRWLALAIALLQA